MVKEEREASRGRKGQHKHLNGDVLLFCGHGVHSALHRNAVTALLAPKVRKAGQGDARLCAEEEMGKGT